MMRQSLLEPLGCIYGVSGKVLSMALSELLLGADPTGALGHHRCEHGRGRYPRAQLAAPDRRPGGAAPRTPMDRRATGRAVAPIIEEAARQIDARQFCPDGPAFFPRFCKRGFGCSAPISASTSATATGSTTENAVRN